MEKRAKKFLILVVCFTIVFLVAFIGSLFTSTNTNSDWYNSIKPSITPPNSVFPIVWSILFFLIALSLFFLWINSNKKQKKKLVWVFGINFILNIVWSLFYFGLREVSLAFFEITLLWISIVSMVFIAWKIDRKAAYLLIPYLLWVSFAVILNYLSIK